MTAAGGASGGNGFLARYAVLGVGEIGARVLSFFVTVLVVRRLGPTAFGQLGFVGSLTTYGVMVATCGLELYGIRTASADRSQLPKVASTILAIRVVASAIVYVGLVGLVVTVPKLRDIRALMALAGLSLFTTGASLAWTTQPLRKTHVLALANFGTQALNLTVLSALISVRGPRLLDVPAAQVAAESAAAAALLAWTLARRSLVAPAIREARAMLAQSLPLGGSQVLRTVAIASDTVILGFLLPMKDVGIYNGAFRLYILCVSLAALYFVILLPELSRVAAAGPRELRLHVRQSLRYAVPLGAVGAATMMLAARPLLVHLFRPELALAAPSLRILMFAVIFGLAAGHFRNALIAQGRQTTDLGIVARGAGVHVLAKVALVPLLGMTGAAVGSALGEAALLLLSVRASRMAAQCAP